MSNAPDASSGVSSEQIDALLLGLLSEAEAEALESRARSDRELAARLERRRQEHREFDPNSGLADLQAQLQRASPSASGGWKIGWLVAALVPAAAVASMAVWIVDAYSPPAQIRLRGEVNTRIVASRDGQRFPVLKDTKVRAGDRLRFVILAPGFDHVALMGIDADGTVRRYSDGAIELPPDGALPFAIELDESGDEERFLVLVGRGRFDDNPYVQALQSGSPLPEHSDIVESWRAIRKTSQ
ncbi:MAG: hypothetical protein AAFP04_02880 [Myxococcota bacterium]